MRRTRFTIAGIALGLWLLTGGVPASAQTARDASEEQKQIQALIADLSSSEEAVRKEATEKLRSMGDEAQRALEAHVAAKAAAADTLDQLDVEKVAGPTLVTLSLKDATAQDAFRALAEQSGYEIEPQNEAMWANANFPAVTLSIEKQPFWRAMQEICAQADISVYTYSSGDRDRKIRIAPAGQMGRGNTMKYPSVIDGAFMIIVTNLSRTNSVDLANPSNIQRNVAMQLQVLAEPKVKILQYGYSPDLEEAVDEKGNALLPANRQRGSSNNNAARSFMFSMSVPLHYPADAGETITRLRGKMRFIVQTRNEMLEIPDVLSEKEITKTLAGRRITVKEVKKTNDRYYQVHATFYRDGLDQQQFDDLVNNPGLRLLDADDREYAYYGTNSSSGGASQKELRFSFYRRSGSNEPGEPAKLVWEVSTATQEIFVPFELTDLPLP